VKSAILSAATVGPVEPNWQTLPPASSRSLSGGAASGEQVAKDSAIPPDPIAFACDPVAQPIWLTSGHQDTLATSPIAKADFVKLFADQNASPPSGDILQALSTATEDAPLIGSKPADSPEGWLAEAQQLAGTAQSTDELSRVIELCQRALNAGAAVESATVLRRLAAWAHNRRGELFTGTS
jgi:hypothetical protein